MKTKTSAALILLLTFLLGVVAGALCYHIYRGYSVDADRRSGAKPGRRDVVQEMAKDLNLDPAQQEQLKRIMEKSRERYRVLSEQVRPQFDVIRDESRQEIRQILRDDQKKRFEERLQELEQRHRNRPGRPPMPGKDGPPR
ncbi:MAG: hypothetical protein HXY20_04825 [Acidobacteria bacterium]|nr:hypothetical protein [Acidobacteriota bacterium]